VWPLWNLIDLRLPWRCNSGKWFDARCHDQAVAELWSNIFWRNPAWRQTYVCKNQPARWEAICSFAWVLYIRDKLLRITSHMLVQTTVKTSAECSKKKFFLTNDISNNSFHTGLSWRFVHGVNWPAKGCWKCSPDLRNFFCVFLTPPILVCAGMC